MPELTDTQRYHQAFDEVMEAYVEAKATNGLIIQGDPVGPCKSNPRLVKPSLTDFIIDVELVLESTTSAPWEGGIEVINQLCGREFLAREISPLPMYLKGIEVQRAR